MSLVRFYVLIIRLAIALALVGKLKACTLVLMGKTAGKHEMMSYLTFTKKRFER